MSWRLFGQGSFEDQLYLVLVNVCVRFSGSHNVFVCPLQTNTEGSDVQVRAELMSSHSWACGGSCGHWLMMCRFTTLLPMFIYWPMWAVSKVDIFLVIAGVVSFIVFSCFIMFCLCCVFPVNMFSFYHAMLCVTKLQREPVNAALNKCEFRKIRSFCPLSCYISEMVQDGPMVSRECS